MTALRAKIFRRRSSVAGKNGAASSLGTRDMGLRARGTGSACRGEAARAADGPLALGRKQDRRWGRQPMHAQARAEAWAAQAQASVERPRRLVLTDNEGRQRKK